MKYSGPARTRVLIVDDAVVMRRIISEVVSGDPELELAGWASNGRIALAKIPQINPDCITLDIEMPDMDGIRTLIEIRKAYPDLPVIMFSTLTERGGTKTLEALCRGATDYVTKPANVGSVVECIERLRSDLVPKIKAYARSKHAIKEPLVPSLRRTAPVRRPATEVEVVCIASSTGGPNALSDVIPALPAEFPLPILIVQHMPPMFTKLFAQRLNELSALIVDEASDGQLVQPGHVYIAPGGRHMEVRSDGAARVSLRLTDDPPENSCRPAADVLFRSVARAYGSSVLAVVLTGMGQDGCRGCRSINEVGGYVVAQDEPSSVVWGMPGAVVEAGLAQQVLPLAEIAGVITSRVSKRVLVPYGR